MRTQAVGGTGRPVVGSFSRSLNRFRLLSAQRCRSSREQRAIWVKASLPINRSLIFIFLSPFSFAEPRLPWFCLGSAVVLPWFCFGALALPHGCPYHTGSARPSPKRFRCNIFLYCCRCYPTPSGTSRALGLFEVGQFHPKTVLQG